MFVITQSESYLWPVKFEMASAEGKFDKQSFDAEFKRLSQSKIKELLEKEGMTDAEFCREVVIGWKGVYDDKHQLIPFSDTWLEKLLELPTVAPAIVQAFIESSYGAKRKN